MVFPKKNIILVGIYNQQFQETIILMVFDLQGIANLLLTASTFKCLHIWKYHDSVDLGFPGTGRGMSGSQSLHLMFK